MRWIQRLFSAVLVAFALVPGAARAEATELVVQYTQPQFFDGAFAKLKEEFEAQNPLCIPSFFLYMTPKIPL